MATGISHVICHSVLQSLTAHGLITMRSVGRSILYRIDTDNVQFSSLLQPLFKNESRLFDLLRDTLLEIIADPNLLSVIVFGSVAKGHAKPNSDIDLLIIVSNSKAVSKLRDKLEHAEEKIIKYFGNQLSPILLTQRAFYRKYKEANSLYREIAKSGVVLYGQTIGEVLTHV